MTSLLKEEIFLFPVLFTYSFTYQKHLDSTCLNAIKGVTTQ